MVRSTRVMASCMSKGSELQFDQIVPIDVQFAIPSVSGTLSYRVLVHTIWNVDHGIRSDLYSKYSYNQIQRNHPQTKIYMENSGLVGYRLTWGCLKAMAPIMHALLQLYY